jgi:hypothetical protein
MHPPTQAGGFLALFCKADCPQWTARWAVRSAHRDQVLGTGLQLRRLDPGYSATTSPFLIA